MKTTFVSTSHNYKCIKFNLYSPDIWEIDCNIYHYSLYFYFISTTENATTAEEMQSILISKWETSLCAEENYATLGMITWVTVGKNGSRQATAHQVRNWHRHTETEGVTVCPPSNRRQNKPFWSPTSKLEFGIFQFGFLVSSVAKRYVRRCVYVKDALHATAIYLDLAGMALELKDLANHMCMHLAT